MKKLLAVLVAGLFAASAFAVEASAPAMNMEKAPAASAAKHGKKKHAKKHHKAHKQASAAN